MVSNEDQAKLDDIKRMAETEAAERQRLTTELKKEKETAQRATSEPVGPTEVRVVDIQMPFMSMVAFMVKWVLASIPAFIILFVFASIATAVFTAIFGTPPQ